jgi:uncharacterized membrane protein
MRAAVRPSLRDALGEPTSIPWTDVRRALAAIVIVAAAVFATLALLRFHTFHNETFDLAFYARMAWGEVHLDAWNPIVDAHSRGLHLSWILIPLGIVGAIFGQAPTLLVTQALAVAGTAWPIARIGARHLGRGGAIVGALAWLLHPNVSHVAANDFHPGTVAVLAIAWTIDALDRRSAAGLQLGTLGVLMCREDLGLVTMLAGLLAIAIARSDGDRGLARAGARSAVGSLVYVLVFVLVLHPLLAPERGSLELHFGRYGSSVVEVVVHLLTHPSDLIAHLGARHRLLYLPMIAAPLALLPFLRPTYLLLALPIVAITLISEFPGTTDLDSHYLTPALPAFVASALRGAAALPDRALLRTAPLLASSILAHAALGGTPLSAAFRPEDHRDDVNSRAARAICARIGPDASVQAPDPILPHLAERELVNRAPPPETRAVFVVLDISHRRRFLHDEDLLRSTEEPLIRSWLARSDHAVIEAGGDYVLFERGRAPRDGIGARVIIARDGDPDAGARLTSCLSLQSAQLASERDGAHLLTLDLVARGPCADDLALRIGRGKRPQRVDLIGGGLLSPAHFERGDRIRSLHRLEPGELDPADLRVGALRSSGARPEHADPMSVRVDGAPSDRAAPPSRSDRAE